MGIGNHDGERDNFEDLRLGFWWLSGVFMRRAWDFMGRCRLQTEISHGIRCVFLRDGIAVIGPFLQKVSLEPIPQRNVASGLIAIAWFATSPSKNWRLLAGGRHIIMVSKICWEPNAVGSSNGTPEEKDLASFQGGFMPFCMSFCFNGCAVLQGVFVWGMRTWQSMMVS